MKKDRQLDLSAFLFSDIMIAFYKNLKFGY